MPPCPRVLYRLLLFSVYSCLIKDGTQSYYRECRKPYHGKEVKNYGKRLHENERRSQPVISVPICFNDNIYLLFRIIVSEFQPSNSFLLLRMQVGIFQNTLIEDLTTSVNNLESANDYNVNELKRSVSNAVIAMKNLQDETRRFNDVVESPRFVL